MVFGRPKEARRIVRTARDLRRVEAFVPDDGEVRVLTITDKQFERMRVFWGKRRKPPEPAPAQLELF